MKNELTVIKKVLNYRAMISMILVPCLLILGACTVKPPRGGHKSPQPTERASGTIPDMMPKADATGPAQTPKADSEIPENNDNEKAIPVTGNTSTPLVDQRLTGIWWVKDSGIHMVIVTSFNDDGTFKESLAAYSSISNYAQTTKGNYKVEGDKITYYSQTYGTAKGYWKNSTLPGYEEIGNIYIEGDMPAEDKTEPISFIDGNHVKIGELIMERSNSTNSTGPESSGVDDEPSATGNSGQIGGTEEQGSLDFKIYPKRADGIAENYPDELVPIYKMDSLMNSEGNTWGVCVEYTTSADFNDVDEYYRNLLKDMTDFEQTENPDVYEDTLHCRSDGWDININILDRQEFRKVLIELYTIIGGNIYLEDQ